MVTKLEKKMIDLFLKEAGFDTLSQAMESIKNTMIKTSWGYDNEYIKVKYGSSELTLAYQSNPRAWCGVCFLFKYYHAGIEKSIKI